MANLSVKFDKEEDMGKIGTRGIPDNQNRKELVAELKKLLKETQALHSENPLTEAEIQAEIDAVRREECE